MPPESPCRGQLTVPCQDAQIYQASLRPWASLYPDLLDCLPYHCHLAECLSNCWEFWEGSDFNLVHLCFAVPNAACTRLVCNVGAEKAVGKHTNLYTNLIRLFFPLTSFFYSILLADIPLNNHCSRLSSFPSVGDKAWRQNVQTENRVISGGSRHIL